MFKDTNDFILFATEKENINEAKKLLNYCKDKHEMVDLFWDMHLQWIIKEIPKTYDILPICLFFFILKISK